MSRQTKPRAWRTSLRPSGVEYITKLVLISLYLGVFVIFAVSQNLERLEFNILDLVVLGLAVFRLGRLVAYDRVFEPVRAPFTVTVPDETGAGESVEPKGTGVQRAIGQLVSCPICAGTWIAALLIYGLYLLPGPTRLLMWMAAVVGVAQVLGALVEVLSWSGQLSRTRAGAILIERRYWEPPSNGGADIPVTAPSAGEITQPPQAKIVQADCPEEDDGSVFRPATRHSINPR
jgi:hypothetical protein